MKIYQCDHCGYIGPCYGTPIIGGRKSGVSAPWCKQCQKNDKLKIYNKPLEPTIEGSAKNKD